MEGPFRHAICATFATGGNCVALLQKEVICLESHCNAATLQRCNTVMTIEVALAHCSRDANGLLKLGGLWLNAGLASDNLSKLVRRHALEVTNVKGWAKKRGFYAQESVARKLAQLIPAQHLWQDGGSETNGELRQPLEAPVATLNVATEEISPADTSDSGVTEQNSGVTEPTLPGDTAVATRTFNGLIIERQTCDGFFNGTSMCSAFKKSFKHYLRNNRTSEYLDALAAQSQVAQSQALSESALRNRKVDFATVRASLVQVQNGGPNRGSWIHERVAVDLARWLSPDFAVWMDGWVLEGLGLSSEPSVPSASMPPAIMEQTYVPRKPLVIQDENSVGLPGGEHLYAALRVGENIIKVGVSKDVLERLKTLSQQFKGKYELLAVWPNECVLEDIVLDLLKSSKTPVSSSREHFNANASFEYICQIVQAARNLYKLKMDLEATTSKRKREGIDSQAASKKRTREEAEEERVIAEIDASRDLAVAELCAKREFAIDREQLSTDRERLMLRLAAEGNADAIKALFAPKP